MNEVPTQSVAIDETIVSTEALVAKSQPSKFCLAISADNLSRLYQSGRGGEEDWLRNGLCTGTANVGREGARYY